MDTFSFDTSHEPMDAIIEEGAPLFDDGPNKRQRKMFTCESCGKQYTERRTLTRHQRSSQACLRPGLTSSWSTCNYCGKTFGRLDECTRHKNETHLKMRRKMPNKDSGKARTEGSASMPWEDGSVMEPFNGIESGDGAADAFEDGFHVPSVPRPPESHLHDVIEPDGPQRGLDLLKDGRNTPSTHSSSSEGHDSGVDLQPAVLESTQMCHRSGPMVATQDEDALEPSALRGLPMLGSTSPSAWPPGSLGFLDLTEFETLAHTHNTPDELRDSVELGSTIDLDFSDLIDSPVSVCETSVSLNDGASVHSASSRRSIDSTLGRLVRGRRSVSIKSRKCGMCRKPYESEATKLREHLTAHLEQMRAETAWPICHICEVGFVHEQDLEHHTRRAASGGCCSLQVNHEGECEGHLCGFNFRHDVPCNGHHPPGIDGQEWSDYDRFKYGQLLRKWELSQLRTVEKDVQYALHLRQIGSALKNASLPELRLLRRLSKTSLFSWRSEPIQPGYELGDLQEQMAKLELDGAVVNFRRNARRLIRLQIDVDGLLEDAVRGNVVEQAQKLVKRGARPKDYLLTIAAGEGSTEMVDVLMRAGAVPQIEAIYKAVLRRRPRVIERLVRCPSARRQLDTEGPVVLQLAVRLHDDSTTLALLNAGLAVDRCPSAEQLAALRPEISNAHLYQTLVEIGLKSPGNLLTMDTPLYVASQRGQVSTVKVLIEAGANVNTESAHGFALDRALIDNNFDCATLLIDAGADLSSQDASGLSPLERAVTDRNIQAISILLPSNSSDLNLALRTIFADNRNDSDAQVSIIKMLLDHGAYVDARDSAGFTPLLRACQQGRTKVGEALLCAGADPMGVSLHAALRLRVSPERLAQFIRDRIADGAAVDDEDGERISPLCLAVREGREEAVEILLHAGASATCRALHAALKSSRESALRVVERLIASGADVNELDRELHVSLYDAAARGHVPAFCRLWEAAEGAGVSGKDKDWVMRRYHAPEIKRLLGKMGVKAG